MAFYPPNPKTASLFNMLRDTACTSDDLREEVMAEEMGGRCVRPMDAAAQRTLNSYGDAFSYNG